MEPRLGTTDIDISTIMTPLVNFTNVLRAAFFYASESRKLKKYSQVINLFSAFRIYSRKTAHKTLMKSTPWGAAKYFDDL
jgi:hypothetical protein